jgi:hypothetical protein
MWLLVEDFELEKSESGRSGGGQGDSYKELIGMEGDKIAAQAFKNDPILPPPFFLTSLLPHIARHIHACSRNKNGCVKLYRQSKFCLSSVFNIALFVGGW